MRVLLNTRRTVVNTIKSSDYKFYMDQLESYKNQGMIDQSDYERMVKHYHDRFMSSRDYQALIDRGYILYKVERTYETKKDPRDLLGEISVVLDYEIKQADPITNYVMSDEEIARVQDMENNRESSKEMREVLIQLVETSNNISSLVSRYVSEGSNKENLNNLKVDAYTILDASKIKISRDSGNNSDRDKQLNKSGSNEGFLNKIINRFRR